MVVIGFADVIRQDLADGAFGRLAVHLMVMLIIAAIIYGGFVYQFARLAFLRRLAAHIAEPAPDDRTLFDGDAPSLCVLVPSYKEELRVVEMTLLSAALQDYPARSVALLLDDPPNPSSAEDAGRLAAMRRLPGEIEARFAPRRRRMAQALAAYRTRLANGVSDPVTEDRRLATLYDEAADWLLALAGDFPPTDHASTVFVDKVLHRQEAALRGRAAELRRTRAGDPGDAPHLRDYRRLVALFDVRLSGFERKRFVNLSHEPNKAMNLNSYLGLMGQSFEPKSLVDGLHLVPTENGSLNVPWFDYVITLDADSLLLCDYARRLVHLMESDAGARIAVAQTPYTAFPGAPAGIERIAGATTDMQYIIHQGFTGYDATYWVGANALLRRAALDDIAVHELERGHRVTRYIQDRTVIEDTESTIDLVAAGWGLHNYPERLAYSATPPDFGSLVIQRQRWANGGLLILPKLLRHLAGRFPSRGMIGEGFMRIHYLLSIAAVNFGLVVLLALPVTKDVVSVWLPLTALAYFFLYGRDLVRLGYRASDLLRVYALNLLLIPVNISGVVTSLGQAVRKTKIPFKRTPKVAGRTAAPALFLAVEYALVVHWLLGGAFEPAGERWVHGLFAVTHAIILGYALVAFVGLRATWEDLTAQVRLPGRGKPQRTRPVTVDASAATLEPARLAASGREDRGAAAAFVVADRMPAYSGP